MTTVRVEQLTCAVCGHRDRYTRLTSSNRFGAPDLDSRPPEMLRSTISLWVQACQVCGYCAPDVSQLPPPGAADLVRSKDYQTLLNSPDFPRLANEFLCWARLLEASDPVRAGWARLHAAWVCDDAGNQPAAGACRLQAAELWQRVLAAGARLLADIGTDYALLADLLRRAGQFEAAEAVCERGLAQDPEQPVHAILKFQRVLSTRRDTARYTVAQALDVQ